MESASLETVIKAYRECKTAAEERQFVVGLRAAIRLKLGEWDAAGKAAGILKLVWINLLGYETAFSQIECIAALFRQNFRLKVIGYLGLPLLINEQSDVLCMATNIIRSDLEQRRNDAVTALALRAFAELANAQMVAELFPSLRRLVAGGSERVKRRALLAVAAALRRSPEHCEEAAELAREALLNGERALTLAAMQLARQSLRVQPKLSECFTDCLERLYRTLSEIGATTIGAKDPFLSCFVLAFVREIVAGRPALAGAAAAQAIAVYNATRAGDSSSTRALLYECSRLMLAVGSVAVQRAGVAVLGDFLALRSKNHLHCALSLLEDVPATQRGEATRFAAALRRCARGRDVTLRAMALRVLANATDAASARTTLRLVGERLRTETEVKAAAELTRIAEEIIERNTSDFALRQQRLFDLIAVCRVCSPDASLSRFLNAFAQSPRWQTYFLFRALLSLEGAGEHTANAVFWLLGEFYELLFIGQDVAGTKAPTAEPMRVIAAMRSAARGRSLPTLRTLLFAAAKICAKARAAEERTAARAIIEAFAAGKDALLARKAAELAAALDCGVGAAALFEAAPIVEIALSPFSEEEPDYSQLESEIGAFNKGAETDFGESDESPIDLLSLQTPIDTPAIDLLSLEVPARPIDVPAPEPEFCLQSTHWPDERVCDVAIGASNPRSAPALDVTFAVSAAAPWKVVAMNQTLFALPGESRDLVVCEVRLESEERPSDVGELHFDVSYVQSGAPKQLKYFAAIPLNGD